MNAIRAPSAVLSVTHPQTSSRMASRILAGVEARLAAGSFRAWRAEFLAALDGAGSVDVPCGSCTACCRSRYFITIEPDEREALARIPKPLLVPAPGKPKGHVVMGFDQEGRCPMLGEHGCTIYEHRPRTCRSYDCRVFAATGVVPTGKPHIAAQAARWEFDHPTGADLESQRRVQAVAQGLLASHPDHDSTAIAIEALRS